MPDIPPNVSLPLLGIGLVSLLLSFIFCIYMWRLRCRAREERGYKRIQYKQNKKFPTMCAVCLEEFSHNEYIAMCRCAHCFHMICLLQWLKHRNFCPMCKATVQRVPPGERSSLITIPQQVVPSTSSNEPATIDTETVWSRTDDSRSVYNVCIHLIYISDCDIVLYAVQCKFTFLHLVQTILLMMDKIILTLPSFPLFIVFHIKMQFGHELNSG